MTKEEAAEVVLAGKPLGPSPGPIMIQFFRESVKKQGPRRLREYIQKWRKYVDAMTLLDLKLPLGRLLARPEHLEGDLKQLEELLQRCEAAGEVGWP